MPGAGEPVVLELGTDLLSRSGARMVPMVNGILERSGAVGSGEVLPHRRIEVERLTDLLAQPRAHDLAAPLAGGDQGGAGQGFSELGCWPPPGRRGLCERAPLQGSGYPFGQESLAPRGLLSDGSGENGQFLLEPIPPQELLSREFSGQGRPSKCRCGHLLSLLTIHEPTGNSGYQNRVELSTLNFEYRPESQTRFTVRRPACHERRQKGPAWTPNSPRRAKRCCPGRR